MNMETVFLTLPLWGWILDVSLILLIDSLLSSLDGDEYGPINAFVVGFAVFGLVKVVVHLA